MEEEFYGATELDDLDIYGPTADFGEVYYEDILDEDDFYTDLFWEEDDYV